MKIYTYHENINFSDQDELIALWKKSWERQGFDAIVLNRSHAVVHPYYEEFVEKLEELHLQIMNKPLSKYGLSCYLRWLAYATQPEEKFYVSDYDVINNKFKQNEPSDELHLMDADCPCIASGTPKQFENLCHAFVDVTLERLEALRGNITPHYHDQEFFTKNFVLRLLPKAEEFLKRYNVKMTRDRKMLNGMIMDLPEEKDIANFDLIHFSHSFIYQKTKIHSSKNRLEETKNIASLYLGL